MTGSNDQNEFGDDDRQQDAMKYDPSKYDRSEYDGHEFEKFLPTDDDEGTALSDQYSRFQEFDESLEVDGQAFCSGKIDSLIWQRLVDCQLPDEQYQELLQLLEHQPELWRDCALAFLEKQAWANAIADLGIKPVPMPVKSQPMSVEPRPVEPRRIASVDAPANFTAIGLAGSNSSKPTSAKRNWLRPLVIWLPTSIAAIALFTITQLQNSSLSTFEVAPSSNSSPTIANVAEFSNDTVGLLAEKFNELTEDQKQHVLMSDVGHRFSATVPTSPAIFRERPVDSSRSFLLMKDMKGRYFVVPVDRFKPHTLVVQ